jgi:Ser/Thr protein kinase RdoA (MazF antagonist)
VDAGDDAVMTEVLAAWDWGGDVTVAQADSGLINRTWWVRGAGGPVAVLQQLNTKIFRAEVHDDIEAVTARLADRGLETPRLVRTRAGTLWHTAADGGVYRVLTPVGERTVHKLTEPADARAAGALVARFHAAVRDLDWQFRMVRPGVHDTAAHYQRLRDALEAHRSHRLYDQVAPLAEQILGGWSPSDDPGLPLRVLHGDLKISNVRFAGPRAVALIDLDTFQHGTLDIELGDAMRSWCNPLPEDSLDARFDVDLFAAAMAGYAEGAGAGGPSEAEWAAIVPGVQRVALELASRFAMDALVESYFGFDPKYGGRGEHNLLRARGQAALAASARAQQGEAELAVATARRIA